MQISRFVLAAALITMTLPAFAEEADELATMTPDERREYIESLSDDERNALREQLRAKRDAMSDEERQALRDERRARWEAMSDEERRTARERMQRNANSMSDEERAAAREKHRKRSEQRRSRHKDRDEAQQ
ncbi:MAG: DUF3106 domain-containing protein [Woeseiaceae bacterium]|nr:DUF3106 domain-containing protein [Woeseiaceae bacterium]